ncbi:lysozyme inhibitor LprI family protein [Consotaella salsifontis]|uniref:Uncharacterized conserved protein YecT, DUF1311 family n=1 Tax=Consotaella salsifontis TaxID=1365950 RepID=A0A1T4PTC6_9HYPH|nr:lysozyme inhibitor LprI family protein [Consotaella salsifontis]SJZ94805.1 Uncharacterized conserved protein YecT, DUF1311 family [Consotaella salsifontis]
MSYARALVLAATFLTAPAVAEEAADTDPACEQATTQGIVECLSDQAERWDTRLNAAYKTAMDGMSEERRKGLRDVQRQWIAWRDANCGWYAEGEGTISRIEAAECDRSLTRARALELEELGSK